MSMTFFSWDQLGFEKRGGKLVRKKLPDLDGIQPMGRPTPEEARLQAAQDENSRLTAELAQVDEDEQAVADAERIEAENEILRHELQTRATTKGAHVDRNLKDLQALDALVAKASTGKAAEILAKCDEIYERRVASIRKAEGCSAYEAYAKASAEDDVAKQAYALSKEMADRIARDARAAAR